VSQLAAGTYVLKAVDPGAAFTVRFVVER